MQGPRESCASVGVCRCVRWNQEVQWTAGIEPCSKCPAPSHLSPTCRLSCRVCGVCYRALLLSTRLAFACFPTTGTRSVSQHLTEVRTLIKSTLALRFRIRGALLEEQSTNKNRYTFPTCRLSFQGFLNWHRKPSFGFRIVGIYFRSRPLG